MKISLKEPLKICTGANYKQDNFGNGKSNRFTAFLPIQKNKSENICFVVLTTEI